VKLDRLPKSGLETMRAMDATGLSWLMRRSAGAPAVGIGVVDGPVDTDHPAFAPGRIRRLGPRPLLRGGLTPGAGFHGTFVAGLLGARRDAAAPGIAPDCPLYVRPIFADAPADRSAGAGDLAAAIEDCLAAGVRVINLSLTLTPGDWDADRQVCAQLDRAVRRDIVIVAAAGDDFAGGGSAITRHPGVIPVAACDAAGRPMSPGALGASTGARGIGAPGQGILGPRAGGGAARMSGSSVATPFVSGAAALLWSLFPRLSAGALRVALRQGSAADAGGGRRTVAPPFLNALGAYRSAQVFSRASA
jgi:subtilisin family serine protease